MKNKDIIIPDDEKLEHLITEIKSTRSVKELDSKMAIIEGRHHIGKTILKHELYKKWKQGTGDLIARISKETKISASDLYLYIQVAKTYPEISAIIEKLSSKPTWTSIRRLIEGKEEKCKHDWHKIEAYECKKCSALRRTKP